MFYKVSPDFGTTTIVEVIFLESNADRLEIGTAYSVYELDCVGKITLK